MVKTKLGIYARRTATVILLLVLQFLLVTKCKAQVPAFLEKIHFDDDAAHFHAAFWPTYITMRRLDKYYDRRLIKPKHYKRRIYFAALGIGLGLTTLKEVGWDLLLKKGVPSWKDQGFGTYGTGVGIMVGTCDIDFRQRRKEERLNRAKNIFE